MNHHHHPKGGGVAYGSECRTARFLAPGFTVDSETLWHVGVLQEETPKQCWLKTGVFGNLRICWGFVVIFLQQRNCLSRVDANTFGCQARTPKLVVVGGGRRLLVSSELAYRHSAGCHIAINTAAQPHSRCPILPHSQIELPYSRGVIGQFCNIAKLRFCKVALLPLCSFAIAICPCNTQLGWGGGGWQLGC